MSHFALIVSALAVGPLRKHVAVDVLKEEAASDDNGHAAAPDADGAAGGMTQDQKTRAFMKNFLTKRLKMSENKAAPAAPAPAAPDGVEYIDVSEGSETAKKFTSDFKALLVVRIDPQKYELEAVMHGEAGLHNLGDIVKDYKENTNKQPVAAINAGFFNMVSRLEDEESLFSDTVCPHLEDSPLRKAGNVFLSRRHGESDSFLRTKRGDKDKRANCKNRPAAFFEDNGDVNFQEGILDKPLLDTNAPSGVGGGPLLIRDGKCLVLQNPESPQRAEWEKLLGKKFGDWWATPLYRQVLATEKNGKILLITAEATIGGLCEIINAFGAEIHNALNLDGGLSTATMIKSRDNDDFICQVEQKEPGSATKDGDCGRPILTAIVAVPK